MPLDGELDHSGDRFLPALDGPADEARARNTNRPSLSRCDRLCSCNAWLIARRRKAIVSCVLTSSEFYGCSSADNVEVIGL